MAERSSVARGPSRRAGPHGMARLHRFHLMKTQNACCRVFLWRRRARSRPFAPFERRAPRLAVRHQRASTSPSPGPSASVRFGSTCVVGCPDMPAHALCLDGTEARVHAHVQQVTPASGCVGVVPALCVVAVHRHVPDGRCGRHGPDGSRRHRRGAASGLRRQRLGAHVCSALEAARDTAGTGRGVGFDGDLPHGRWKEQGGEFQCRC